MIDGSTLVIEIQQTTELKIVKINEFG